MAILTIFRGLPGAGKTQRAKYLVDKTGAMLVEPDALLIVNGAYVYTPERYEAARYRCIDIIVSAVYADAMSPCRLHPDFVYADVLPRRYDVLEVIRVLPGEYRVDVIDCIITREQSSLLNRHNVRAEDIDRMAREWEEWI